MIRHQEGVFVADHVAQTAEDKRASGAHKKTRRTTQERGDERRCGVETDEKVRGDEDSQ